ncbi:MAG: hypothetical protein A3F92_03700 [Candidatus Rokubacteria bacterium RIFCSPLOWO2_12_FULL_71_22]|nr:MAG: hypothetical protein A3F92_03700 [Candidatus Rokubacteria bacterium RIFCSPLOWO2_12_FULL_71_22]
MEQALGHEGATTPRKVSFLLVLALVVRVVQPSFTRRIWMPHDHLSVASFLLSSWRRQGQNHDTKALGVLMAKGWAGVASGGIALFFALMLCTSPPARAGTFNPWTQTGHDAAHTYANAGPSPAIDAPFWASSVGGIQQVEAVAQGLVFARSASGVVAVDQMSGALVRTYGAGSVRSLAVSGNRLIVSDEGTVRAFDVASGTMLWSRALPIPTIAVDAGRVFVNTGLGDGHLRALDVATGNILWSVAGVGNASSPPTVAGGIVFQNSAVGGTVLALDAATGAPAWSASVGTVISSPVANATQLFVGVQSSHFLALSQATGAVLWDTSLPGEIYAGGTVGDLAFALSFSGNVYAVNAATGVIEWSFAAGSCCTGVASADGRLFSSGSAGLFALDQATGALLWSHDGAFTPIVADGLVFAQSGGDIVAIGTPVPEPSTLFLLATGLAGLAGAGWRARRRT